MPAWEYKSSAGRAAGQAECEAEGRSNQHGDDTMVLPRATNESCDLDECCRSGQGCETGSDAW